MDIDMNKFQGWSANLSNGYNVFEGTPQPGEKTPWQQFIDYLQSGPTYEAEQTNKETGEVTKVQKPIVVTRMRLQWNKTNVVSLGHKNCDGYFCAREIRKSVFLPNEAPARHYYGLGSVVGDKVFITWVDEHGEVVQDVRPLEEVRAHTTLRKANANPTSNEPGPGSTP